MSRLEHAINSVLNSDNITPEYLQTVPDLSSEDVRSVILGILTEVYSNRMPFNKYLGIRVSELTMDYTVVTIDAKEELYGNYVQKILHGGVISSVIDLSGGIIAQVNALTRMSGMTIAELLARFSKMSTINMHVDYLRPGSGSRFSCRAHVLKGGNKVAATRMDMFDEKGNLIATGSGAYLVG